MVTGWNLKILKMQFASGSLQAWLRYELGTTVLISYEYSGQNFKELKCISQ